MGEKLKTGHGQTGGKATVISTRPQAAGTG